jgi:hypothetical protein
MRPAAWVALWAAMLAVFTAVMAFFGSIDAYSPWLLGGAALGTLALAAAGARSGERGGAPRTVPDASPATVAAAVGVVLLVGGTEVGAWMGLIGAGVLALGLGGLVREHRAERRLR